LKAKNNITEAPAISETAGASAKKIIIVRGREEKNEELDSIYTTRTHYLGYISSSIYFFCIICTKFFKLANYF